jgi:hypothetical protein
VPRRWVRYQLPVMVCVDVSDTEDHEQITKVVLGTDDEDRQPDRDPNGQVLVYDERMERIGADDPYARQALQAADPSQWPPRRDWEEGPDALHDRWLYEDGDLEDDHEDDHDAGEVAVAVDPAGQP